VTINNWSGVGYLTADPEIKEVGEGDKAREVVNFSIGINTRWGKEDSQSRVDFINITAWNGMAKFLGKFFKKGHKIEVTGSLRTDKYKKQGDDKHTYKTYVLANTLDFGSTKAEKNLDATQPSENTHLPKTEPKAEPEQAVLVGNTEEEPPF